MKSSTTVLLVLFNSLLVGCDSSTEPKIVRGVWASFDKSAYKFSSDTFADTARLTITNNSDTTILGWVPSELFYKRDTVWVIASWADYPWFRPIPAFTELTTKYRFYDFNEPQYFPDGTYKLLIEYMADTNVVGKNWYRAMYTGEVNLTH